MMQGEYDNLFDNLAIRYLAYTMYYVEIAEAIWNLLT